MGLHGRHRGSERAARLRRVGTGQYGSDLILSSGLRSGFRDPWAMLKCRDEGGRGVSESDGEQPMLML